MSLPEEHVNNVYNTVEPAPAGSIQDVSKFQFGNQDIRENNSLDKVRDILFGNQMRDVEKRFTRLEERLVKDSTNLRDETRKRLDSLEIYIKKEVDSLTEQLKKEEAERDELVKELAEEHRNITKSLDKKLTQFDQQTTQSQRELREHILNQSKGLQDDIRQKYEEILALLQRETRELHHEKTDRSTLSALFNELAIRLKSES
jgi:DNA repair exonuclease SbcCD ATPase subunit